MVSIIIFHIAVEFEFIVGCYDFPTLTIFGRTLYLYVLMALVGFAKSYLGDGSRHNTQGKNCEIQR